MVLEGFEIPSWAGWLSGILFYRVPWGLPVYKSWCESFVFYHFTIAGIANLLWADYVIHYTETFAAESVLRLVITKVFTYFAILLFFYVRICFLLKAKGIASFLKRIERHSTFATKSSKNCKPLSWTDKGILWAAFALHIIACIAFSSAVGTQRHRENSWFSILSKFQYSAIFFLFGTFPLSVGSYLAFAYTLVTTKHMVCIFDEFCDYFEFVIKIENGEIPQVIFEPPSLELKNQLFDNPFEPKKMKRNIKTQKELMRENLFSQFDVVFNMFETYDTVVGPFLLGLVITLILYFVQTINAILILELSPLFLAFDWLTLIYLVFQLVLILFNLGHFTHKRMRHRKMKLHRLLVMTPNTIDKIQLNELSNIVSSWKWRMSAWGFFTIDRSLMPGVLSIMMSYVVILFQIQLNTVGK